MWHGFRTNSLFSPILFLLFQTNFGRAHGGWVLLRHGTTLRGNARVRNRGFKQVDQGEKKKKNSINRSIVCALGVPILAHSRVFKCFRENVTGRMITDSAHAIQPGKKSAVRLGSAREYTIGTYLCWQFSGECLSRLPGIDNVLSRSLKTKTSGERKKTETIFILKIFPENYTLFQGPFPKNNVRTPSKLSSTHFCSSPPAISTYE